MENPLQDPDRRVELVHRFFTGTGSSYDAMVNWATLGIDRLWKRKIADRIPPAATRVLDLACGTGISTLAIAARRPQCRVVGVELRGEYLDIARRKVKALGIRNVDLVLSRAEDYRSEEPFDCVVSSYLAKYADLRRLTQATKDMLKGGGLVLMHDFVYPPKAPHAWVWRVYFKMLQHVGSRLFPAWREIYYGLPRLLEETEWIPELTETLGTHAFEDIRVEYLTAYGSAIVTATKGSRSDAIQPFQDPTVSHPH
jgi:demethylmenaquinone methyltransferase / 2-methoxy-6-polyprenyl-1,4-benzoquinol methylase